MTDLKFNVQTRQIFYRIVDNPLEYPLNIVLDYEHYPIWFTTGEFLHLFYEQGLLVAEIEIPDGVELVRQTEESNARQTEVSNVAQTEWHASHFIVRDISYIHRHPILGKDETYILKLIKQFPGHYIKLAENIENPSEEFCQTIVKLHCMALEYIRNPSYWTELEAVKHFGEALFYIKNQTYELCEIAVLNNGRAIKHCWPEFREKLYMKAIDQNPFAFEFLPKHLQTKELCLRMVEQKALLVNCVRPDLLDEPASRQGSSEAQTGVQQDEDIKRAAVEGHGFLIRHFDNPSYELCEIAVRSLKSNYRYIKNKGIRAVICQSFNIVDDGVMLY